MFDASFAVALISSMDEIPAWADPDEFSESAFEGYRGESSCIAIFDCGKVTYHWDCGEPEDNTFGRDWAWVDVAIGRAYERGVADGKRMALEAAQQHPTADGQQQDRRDDG